MFQNLQKIAEQEIIPFALSCDFEAAVIKTVQKLLNNMQNADRKN